MNYFTEVYGSSMPVLVREAVERKYFSPKPLLVSQINAFQRLDFRYEVAFRAARIPEVKAVFTSAYGENAPFFFVWIVVPERNERVYRELFQVEKSLINDYGSIHFDFTIMPAGKKDAKKMVSDPTAKLIFIRDES